MKTIKKLMILSLSMCLAVNLLSAQNQSFWVHTDEVTPGMSQEYEKVSKDFISACKEHKLEGSDWTTARMDDNTYLTIAPIENMGDFDKNPLAPLAEKMGKEAFGKIFERYNKCYDKHGDMVVVLNAALSYMPDGLTTNTEDQNYRKWYYLYVAPSNIQNLKGKLEEIKALYEKKGAKQHYRIYHNGFGSTGDYYVAVVSGKDPVSYAELNKETNDLLGEEGKNLFEDMMKYVLKYETKTGWMRPDLSYTAEKEND
ncbi:hypothetical protein UMM65_07575 [Aureibaculum sp. 2210JD6-5]|uniref:hypothetical protein n=1 Tax=Aureibaculum sp. 2210JD6-5 TaxID=3103957 RepID=UPI002AAD764B|nr:hypothetical protein [Aureibaculum sp. 2210JD6-5]MDY7395097.1 hypothetical protein [Aureibaculum sp. 2210JD6-5]